MRIKGKHDRINEDTLCTEKRSETERSIDYEGGALVTATEPRQLVGIYSRSAFAAQSSAEYYTNVYVHLEFIRESMRKLKWNSQLQAKEKNSWSIAENHVDKWESSIKMR